VTVSSEDNPPTLERAIALTGAGDLAGATRICEAILARDAAHVGALNLLGAIAFLGSDFDTAIARCSRAIAIDPGMALAHANLGLALAGAGRLEDGCAHLARATALDPANPEAFCNLGLMLHRLGRPEAAEVAFQEAVRHRPDHVKALCGLGDLRLDRQAWDAAITFYDAALARRPGYAHAHLNRGHALEGLGRWREALAAYEAAIQVQADYAEAHYNRGGALYRLGRLDQALASCDRAINLKPGYTDAYLRRGAILHALLRLDDAVTSYGEVIARDPLHPQAHLNSAYSRLLKGDFAGGLRQAEWRKHDPALYGRRDDPRPEWTGAEDIAGKTVFLHWEQGYGDTLQFCRYAKLIAARGARVIMSAQDALVSLLASLDPGVAVIGGDQAPPDFDFHAPLMSLPLIFKTDLASIPGEVPYLRPPPEARARWRETLGAKSRPRVGLTWQSGFHPDRPQFWHANARRDISLADMAGVNLPGIEFVSLQKERYGEERYGDAILNSSKSPAAARSWTELSIASPYLSYHSPYLSDFAETAAVIANLDLVITVDTAVAHLAGALGAPVWLLLPLVPDWRWLLERDDSPWYPTMRLFRQTRRDDWPEVITRVRAALAARFG
jgi:tetratricopeptide (TPR) repeat protein